MEILVLGQSEVRELLSPPTHKYLGQKDMYPPWDGDFESVVYGLTINQLMKLGYKIEVQVCFYLFTVIWLVLEVG